MGSSQISPGIKNKIKKDIKTPQSLMVIMESNYGVGYGAIKPLFRALP
jgi:hypothetical protein